VTGQHDCNPEQHPATPSRATPPAPARWISFRHASSTIAVT